ncbi:mannose-6-phosphate isomerase type 3 [Litorimonas taeanensis]|uniref:Mannose-6-phosphate isomerase type 3 n=1 Tax=Litorimonas taeanensis TaxID=568099 RepID=A0A420WF78_9PROT|nr:AGE family epimerase/isomerase [Litorimonas taeanensis]RKQ69644.1 mannose-6-phosphate isomerase type 3 [Litorimonas taeanensis]
MSLSEFITQSERFTSWCQGALKDWHRVAADPRGGFAEFRDITGAPNFDAVRRVRVQFRLAYVYALAGHLGWYDHAQMASDQAWDFATTSGFQSGALDLESGKGGCAHLIGGGGALVDPYRDSYAQAFVILAGAWRYRAFGDIQSLNITESTLAFLDSHLTSEYGGYEEGFPLRGGPRRQNPHMHLFEALLALFEATGDKKYKARIDALYGLFKAHFFDKNTGAIYEFFNSDFTKYKGGGPYEPGHMMEWAWLLSEYERLRAVNMSAEILKLKQAAMEMGYRPKVGFIIDSCVPQGKQTSERFRSWPQTELIKAHVSLALKGDMESLPIISKTIDRMFDTYFQTDVPSGWHDQLDHDGQIIQADMQSSTFYHIICAAAEVSRLQTHLT